jgi:hypothetical protein
MHPIMLLLFAVSLSKRLPLDVPEQERVSAEKSQYAFAGPSLNAIGR